MLLRFANGQTFASGATSYGYEPVTASEHAPRVILSVLLSELQVSAYIDTGGINFLCSPGVAAEIDLRPEDSIGSLRLLFRGTIYLGHLHRIPLTLQADEGSSLTIEVTAFVPQLPPGATWPDEFPCVLGMSGCLERIRFAIDPFTDTFYFGELVDQNF